MNKHKLKPKQSKQMLSKNYLNTKISPISFMYIYIYTEIFRAGLD